MPAVACFDTAFHSSLPDAVGHVRRATRMADSMGRASLWLPRSEPRLRLASNDRTHGTLRRWRPRGHLPPGAGASLAAVVEGRSVDTTMGFTPLEGLVMATRSGTVDPGLILWLAQEQEIPVEDIAHALEYESGLYALAGSSDMAEVEALAAYGHAGSRLALDVYVHRLRAAIAAMISAIGGVDAVTFTGGVGENAAPAAEVLSTMGFLRLSLDEERNCSVQPDAEITGARSRVKVFVVRAREDLQIAAEVRSLFV